MADRNLEIIINAKDQATKIIAWVQKQIKGLEKQTTGFNKTLNNMQPAFKKMAGYWTVATTALWYWFNKAIDISTDLWESINAVEVIFWDGAKTILKYWESAAKSAWISNRAFNQMSTEMGALLWATWLTAQETANETVTLAERAKDMASVFNVDVGIAMSALNQWLRWETEAMRKFASDVTDASLQSYLLWQWIEWTVTKMSQQEKTLLRLDKMMFDTNVTHWDFNNTINSLANRQKILTATTEDTTASFWLLLAPMKQLAFDVLWPILTQIGTFIKENPELTKTLAMVTIWTVAFVAIIGTLWMILPAIITTIWFLTTAVWALSTAFAFLAANPIILLIAAIVALGVVIYKFYEDWDNITLTIKYLWWLMTDSIIEKATWFKDTLIWIWEAIKSALFWIVNDIVITVKSKFQALADFVTGIFEKITWLYNKAKALASKAKSLAWSAVTSVTNFVSWAKATGWTVASWRTYLVWERWPELFTAPWAWNITPNNKMWGSSQTININVTGNHLSNEADEMRLADRIKESLARDISLASNFGIA